MGIGYGKIPPSGMCFCFDGLNTKCYQGSNIFKDLISRTEATAVITSPATLNIQNNHLRFVPGQTTRTSYIPFNSTTITVPTGWTGSWSWFQYFEDQGSIDHPNFGKETGSGWDGINGFVFGTGWGTDGPRWGIGGTAYTVYSQTTTDYVANTWQCWTVTYNGGATNGLKTYLNGSLADQRTPTNVPIGSNSNNLFIGATNSRGGNWGGYMDVIQMWTRELSSEEVFNNFNIYRGRFGI